MKASNVFSLLMVTTLAVAGCGKYEKNPVQDLETMRANGKAEKANPQQGPQTIIKTVVVKEPVETIKERTVIDATSLSISTEDMNFVEGKSATFQVTGKALIPGVTVKLSAQGLPAGATFQAAPTAENKDRYTITWTPAYNTVPQGVAFKSVQFKVLLQVTGVASEENRAAIMALTQSLNITAGVLKSQAVPTDLVVNTPAKVNEGTATPFDVTVTMNGIDDKSAEKPSLVIRYDGVGLTQGNAYLELDGARFIRAESTSLVPQYLGNYKWKFTLLFDTKNQGVSPALNTKGEVIANSEVSNVRLSVKAISPSGVSTPEVVKKVQIVLLKSIEAAKFTMSGMASESLELTPGETQVVAFSVATAAKNATIAVEIPNTKTLTGSPSITCKVSSVTSAKQDCQITWKVPCAATDAELKNEINLAASASAGGRRSDVTTYTLKTVRSQKDKAATCAAAGVAK